MHEVPRDHTLPKSKNKWNVDKTVDIFEMPGATPIAWEYGRF